MNRALQILFISSALIFVSAPWAVQAEMGGDPQACQEGFTLIGDRCVAQTQCEDGSFVGPNESCSNPAPPNHARCEGTSNVIADDVQSCKDLLKSSQQKCDPGQGEFAKVRREGEALAKKMAAADATVNKSSTDVAAFNEKLKSASERAQATCQQAHRDCEQVCTRSQTHSADVAEANSCSADQEIQTMLESQRHSVEKCRGLASYVSKFQEQARSAEVTAKAADQNADATNAAVGDAQAAGADPGSADQASNEEDTSNKKKSGNNDMMSGLMAIASAAMQGMSNQPEVPAAPTVDPAQMASDSCDLPANMSTAICMCARYGSASGQCLAASNANNPTQFSSLTPGSGGAQLTPDVSNTNNLDFSSKTNSAAYVPKPGDPTLNAQPGALVGGGGGFGGAGGGHFTPDQPKGHGGSSLSADIYAGTRGGGSPFGGRGGGPGGSSTSARDPEDLPGYKLDRPNEKTNFQQFMPTGAGMAAASATDSLHGSRGLAGLGLPQGMHASNVDIFQMVTNRYRAVEGSLYP